MARETTLPALLWVCVKGGEPDRSPVFAENEPARRPGYRNNCIIPTSSIVCKHFDMFGIVAPPRQRVAIQDSQCVVPEHPKPPAQAVLRRIGPRFDGRGKHR
jgi:hypothetical protein